jgi:hypothetical protein
VRLRLVAPSLVLAALVAGCGSQPAAKLQHGDAAQLIALTNRIATEDACAQVRDIRSVSARAIQLVNQGRVPAELQEPLLGGVNALAAHHPVCVPAAPVTPPVVPEPTKHGHDKHEHHHGHGKGDDGG